MVNKPDKQNRTRNPEMDPDRFCTTCRSGMA
jgi:hypothetical protein